MFDVACAVIPATGLQLHLDASRLMGYSDGDTAYGTAYGRTVYSMWINGVSIGVGQGEYTSVPTDCPVMTMVLQNDWGSDI